MRRVVSTALLKGDPMSYVQWGILSDKESPALSVEAYALALLEPRRVFGGRLELQILSEQLGFRYYVVSVPSGLTVSNESAQPAGLAVEGPPLILLFHARRQHYDLINPVKRELGQALPVLPSEEEESRRSAHQGPLGPLEGAHIFPSHVTPCLVATPTTSSPLLSSPSRSAMI